MSAGGWPGGSSRSPPGAATFRGGELLDSIPDRYRGEIADIERRLDLKDALDALPAAFRDALVLCYLEGLTHEEAAEKLGCPVGTVRSRLARGRAILRQRMDTDVSGRWSPSTEANDRTESDPSPAAVAPCLIQSTARAAARLAAGHPLAGLVPARVAEVATGVLAMMFRKKLAAMAVVVVIGTLAGWGGWAAQSAPGQEGKGTGQAAIDQPPSDRLRGDFDRPKARRIVFPNPKQADKPAAELPADFPAFVIETQPKLGDIDVDAATVKEIRVTFSKPMMDKSWSWTQGNVYAFPESTGAIHYLPDQRTCVMPVKLEPGKTYVMGINGGRFENFKAKDGRPSLHYGLAFRTGAAK